MAWRSREGNHGWDVTPAAARAIQRRLSRLVDSGAGLQQVGFVAGADVSYPTGRRTAHAAVAVFNARTLDVVESRTAVSPVTFPYIPGLLSFREAPAVLAALEKVACVIDLLLVDGHGLAHPRRFGLACHVGVLTGLPTIGVAKTIHIGSYGTLGELRGATAPLVDGDEVVGSVVRTRAGVRPLFVSVGHRITLESAVRWVLGSAQRYRIPEPLRHAHRIARSSV